MHDRLFAHQDQLEAEELLDHAAALGLDLGRFAQDLGDGTFAQRVRDDVASAEASGVTGTPTFFVNGVRHDGPTDTDALAAALLGSDPRGGTRQPLPDPVAASSRARIYSPPAVLPGIEGLEETPENSSSPRLSAEHLAAFRRAGRRQPMVKGQVLLRAGAPEFDFFVVLEGAIAVVEGPLDGLADGERPRVVAVNGPGRFFGGLNMLAGQRPVRSLVAARPGEVLVFSLEQLRALFSRNRELGELVTRSFLLRRAMLIGQASVLRVIGDRRWPASGELAALLAERDIPHQWLDPADDPAAQRMWAEVGTDGRKVPVVVAPDGRVLVDPTADDLARAAAGAAARDLTTT
jgi:CRP-like cAMP-binding protein